MTDKSFAELGLPEALVKSAAKAGLATPKPIQAQAIPCQLEGRDVLGIAQTGSGKTAAFGLPILAGLAELGARAEPKTAHAMILAPTRELAVQIEAALRSFAGTMRLSTVLVLGGVGREPQIQKLARGVDILIATPGRLVDLLEDRKVRLDATRWVVLDEADRMLDMGFIRDVRRIMSATSARRQTCLFSATMPPEVAELAQGLLKDPVRVEAARQGSTIETVEQTVIMTPGPAKRAKLAQLLASPALESVIVFTRTKHGADRVSKNLAADGFRAEAIHGNKSQGARQRALQGFRDRRVRVLVATDIAARGIDVPGVTHVVNYDVPVEAETYVHRIGRTARNGASGAAITLCADDERDKLRAIERLIRIKLVPEGAPPQRKGEAGEKAAKPQGQPRSKPAGQARSKPQGQAQSKPPGQARPNPQGQARPEPGPSGQKPRRRRNRKPKATAAAGGSMPWAAWR